MNKKYDSAWNNMSLEQKGQYLATTTDKSNKPQATGFPYCALDRGSRNAEESLTMDSRKDKETEMTQSE